MADESWVQAVAPEPKPSLLYFWNDVATKALTATYEYRDELVAMCEDEGDKESIRNLFKQLPNIIDTYILHTIIAADYEGKMFSGEGMDSFNQRDWDLRIKRVMLNLGIPEDSLDAFHTRIDTIIADELKPHQKARTAPTPPPA